MAKTYVLKDTSFKLTLPTTNRALLVLYTPADNSAVLKQCLVKYHTRNPLPPASNKKAWSKLIGCALQNMNTVASNDAGKHHQVYLDLRGLK